MKNGENKLLSTISITEIYNCYRMLILKINVPIILYKNVIRYLYIGAFQYMASYNKKII